MARYKILKIVIMLSVFFIFSYLLANNFNNVDFNDKIVLIPINGVIVSNGGNNFLNDEVTNSGDVINYLKLANEDEKIKGVILEINSPGGTAIGSKEVSDAVKNFNKPIVSLIKGIGASGAYWVASSSDAIIADPLSITGSIGVIGSYLEFEGLMNKYGVKYERLVTGKYKDLGSPYKTLTEEERQLLLKKLNIIHDMFSKEVSKNRKKDLSKYSNGEFFLGVEAKEIGLIDHLGNKETAIDLTKKMANITEAKIVTFASKKGFFSSLDKYFSKYSYYIGLGISEGSLNNEKFSINT